VTGVWVNGNWIYNQENVGAYHYNGFAVSVPPELLVTGANVLAVRVQNVAGSGAIPPGAYIGMGYKLVVS
jgi:hypothetical protein